MAMGVDVGMAGVTAMATVVIRTADGVVRMVMAAIPAPMAPRMVTLPRRLHPLNQPSRPLASNPAGKTDDLHRDVSARLYFTGQLVFIIKL